MRMDMAKKDHRSARKDLLLEIEVTVEIVVVAVTVAEVEEATAEAVVIAEVVVIADPEGIIDKIIKGLPIREPFFIAFINNR